MKVIPNINYLLLQNLNIPVPEAIPVNHAHGDGESEDNSKPPTKRARTDITSNNLAAGSVVTGTKVFALPSGIVTCNTQICEVIKTVKPVIRALVEDCNYYFELNIKIHF